MAYKCFEEPVYAKGDGLFVRTEIREGDIPFVGFIKTKYGESQVRYDNKDLTEVLLRGEEITKNEYDKGS